MGSTPSKIRHCRNTVRCTTLVLFPLLDCSFFLAFGASSTAYTKLIYPTPAPSHAKYPFYTAGGGDKRWLMSGEEEEEGLFWVGGLMYVPLRFEPAQGLSPWSSDCYIGSWPNCSADTFTIRLATGIPFKIWVW